jgi:Flp pilus assembly protein TadD
MWKTDIILRGKFVLIFTALFCTHHEELHAQAPANQVTNSTIVGIEGTVRLARVGSPRFDEPSINWPLLVGDRVVVGPRSQLTVRRLDESIYRFPEMSEFQVQAPKTASTTRSSFRLLSGVLYFFHRGKPGEVEVETPSASAAVRGTEFVISVDAAGTTIVTVIDGMVDLSNQIGGVTVRNGEEGVAQVGQVPVVRPALNMADTIEWMLYYPGVLDAQELVITEAERTALAESMAAYASGDLVGALARRSENTAGVASGIYHAALLLSVGQVEDAQRLLTAATQGLGAEGGDNLRLAEALRELIAVVKSGVAPRGNAPELATEWMVESYRLQSSRQLEGALAAARNAVAKSTSFSFAWARVAELEFSFGRIDAAKDAVERALELGPRNAQAASLKGFLWAAQNKTKLAAAQFERAIELDPSLANAWLGRGLVRIRSGDAAEGRADLLTAAALEPQRGFLRSYLAKAWTDAGKEDLAAHEIELAKALDPEDPTAWLYSALLKYQQNRINEAVRELEHAQTINTNRAVYRSSFLLDQDQAVRSANLAKIYRDAGMFDWSVREAGRAVTADYANYSAHLFLAESYTFLRNPAYVNFRYEAAESGEYLIANLLAPVGAGILSPTISQGEYSKLFERNGFGLLSVAEYLSRGAWRVDGAQYGVFGNSSYSVEAGYLSDPGQFENDDLDAEDYKFRFKQQLSPADMVYISAEQLEVQSGDVAQRYDPEIRSSTGRSYERRPLFTLGFHHEWSPESRTLLYASVLRNDYSAFNGPGGSLFARRPEGPIASIHDFAFDRSYDHEIKLFTLEGQQIWARGPNQLIVGARYQNATIDAHELLTNPYDYFLFFPFGEPATDVSPSLDFRRYSAYAYNTWDFNESFSVTAGLAYDYVEYPANIVTSPISASSTDVDQISPKAGFIWRPGANSALRLGYAKSLSGMSLDQGLRIEPTQVAGFNQSLRGLVPLSFDYSTPGEEIDMAALSLEHKFPTRTYLGLQIDRLTSEGNRTRGVFLDPGFDSVDFVAIPSTITENIEFEENAITLSLNQLVAEEWAFGLLYRIADSQHDRTFPSLPPPSPDGDPARKPEERIESVLHTVSGIVRFNHHSGFFAGLDANWYIQDVDGFGPNFENDDFWQFNATAGYRFWRRRAEASVGLLNITDQDYRLLPLNFYADLPRERTIMMRLRLHL